MIAREPWMTGLRKTTLYSTNGVSTPSQWASIAAMETPVEAFTKIREGYQERRDLMVKGLNDTGLLCENPAGAFYAFPDVRGCLKGKLQSSGDFANALLEKEQTVVTDGAAFGAEGFIRISYATSMDRLQEGVNRIRRVCSASW